MSKIIWHIIYFYKGNWELTSTSYGVSWVIKEDLSEETLELSLESKSESSNNANIWVQSVSGKEKIKRQGSKYNNGLAIFEEQKEGMCAVML